MVRTIYVVFVEDKTSCTSNLKEYMFLCPFDYVKVGDLIMDPRYTSYMQVTRITPCCARVQEGFTLKDIQIESLNKRKIAVTQGSDFDIDDFDTDKRNMERRDISVTLEEAIEWYNSGNTTLRTLALNVYTKDELELNYALIASRVSKYRNAFVIPLCEGRKFQVLTKLAIIANYFNKDWKKTVCNTGYFLGNYNTTNGPVVNCYNGVGIYQHNTVQYAGVVYFKNQEDAIKAVKILGPEVRELFK